MKTTKLILLLAISLTSCKGPSGIDSEINELVPFPDPNYYTCLRAPQSVEIDGNLTDEEWADIPWTVSFMDIEGPAKAKPTYSTKAKMMWDDHYLYVAAEIKEPHVWATITERDEVIFYDNDFEVFIDPDGDTHHYYELEVNAFGTPWDLMLTKPYRDGGYAVDSWDIAGLKLGVSVQGTINDPEDIDEGWTVEMAIPFKVLEECSPKTSPPAAGDTWRINFSRVEWQVLVENGKYVKKTNPETGKSFPENNWVWSPQDHINMHMPEYWGFLYFSDASQIQDNSSGEIDQSEKVKWVLRNIYYEQSAYFEINGEYAEDLEALGLIESLTDIGFQLPTVEKTIFGFNAYLPADGGHYWVINEEGEVKIK
ncbi:MAG: carbohydrate-binding family 9-like protein [Bacteroidetes bacterium]|jgi:hypothetical protein|nr:carbohydrate-binding family 9-like protein [Bacteroidota bacterium]MBT3748950.1 carbohydrate-binding family 9-like protein [Bacteroidota bacterium]MBT4400335.1 carbohydrate-binding family 9-like protein [Bacteroidota bacterium]MBT4408615.1 carbohydrate-binding family 9-like protein [Bacteroidota bacterium]MBT5425739.1 carbohydrate-binding family 9-like protein [Bacteroidota bacterium]